MHCCGPVGAKQLRLGFNITHTAAIYPHRARVAGGRADVSGAAAGAAAYRRGLQRPLPCVMHDVDRPTELRLRLLQNEKMHGATQALPTCADAAA